MFQKGYYWISIVEEKKKLISQVVYFVTNWVYKKKWIWNLRKALQFITNYGYFFYIDFGLFKHTLGSG